MLCCCRGKILTLHTSCPSIIEAHEVLQFAALGGLLTNYSNLQSHKRPIDYHPDKSTRRWFPGFFAPHFSTASMGPHPRSAAQRSTFATSPKTYAHQKSLRSISIATPTSSTTAAAKTTATTPQQLLLLRLLQELQLHYCKYCSCSCCSSSFCGCCPCIAVLMLAAGSVCGGHV